MMIQAAVIMLGVAYYIKRSGADLRRPSAGLARRRKDGRHHAVGAVLTKFLVVAVFALLASAFPLRPGHWRR